MRRLILVTLTAIYLSGCAATDQEVGTVLGSTAAGAAIGALGGAALDPWDRNRGATSGALAGAAIGGAIGWTYVTQQHRDPYHRSYTYNYQAPPPPPRNYRGERCVFTEFTDGSMGASLPQSTVAPVFRRPITATTEQTEGQEGAGVSNNNKTMFAPTDLLHAPSRCSSATAMSMWETKRGDLHHFGDIDPTRSITHLGAEQRNEIPGNGGMFLCRSWYGEDFALA